MNVIIDQNNKVTLEWMKKQLSRKKPKLTFNPRSYSEAMESLESLGLNTTPNSLKDENNTIEESTNKTL